VSRELIRCERTVDCKEFEIDAFLDALESFCILKNPTLFVLDSDTDPNAGHNVYSQAHHKNDFEKLQSVEHERQPTDELLLKGLTQPSDVHQKPSNRSKLTDLKVKGCWMLVR